MSSPVEPRVLWTVHDLARFAQVSVRRVYAWVERGQIPFLRVGPRAVRFDPDVVLEHFRKSTAR